MWRAGQWLPEEGLGNGMDVAAETLMVMLQYSDGD